MITHGGEPGFSAVLVIARKILIRSKVLEMGPKSPEGPFPQGNGGNGILRRKSFGDVSTQRAQNSSLGGQFLGEDCRVRYLQERRHFKVFFQKLRHPNINSLAEKYGNANKYLFFSLQCSLK